MKAMHEFYDNSLSIWGEIVKGKLNIYIMKNQTGTLYLTTETKLSSKWF